MDLSGIDASTEIKIIQTDAGASLETPVTITINVNQAYLDTPKRQTYIIISWHDISNNLMLGNLQLPFETPTSLSTTYSIGDHVNDIIEFKDRHIQKSAYPLTLLYTNAENRNVWYPWGNQIFSLQVHTAFDEPTMTRLPSDVNQFFKISILDQRTLQPEYFIEGIAANDVITYPIPDGHAKAFLIKANKPFLDNFNVGDSKLILNWRYENPLPSSNPEIPPQEENSGLISHVPPYWNGNLDLLTAVPFEALYRTLPAYGTPSPSENPGLYDVPWGLNNFYITSYFVLNDGTSMEKRMPTEGYFTINKPEVPIGNSKGMNKGNAKGDMKGNVNMKGFSKGNAPANAPSNAPANAPSNAPAKAPANAPANAQSAGYRRYTRRKQRNKKRKTHRRRRYARK